MNFVFTGGGTAGHVTPNIALIPLMQQKGYTVHYIGRCEGIEKELIEKMPGVIYHGISAGKLRRYNNIKNLTDPFRVVKGYFQALKLMKEIKPAGLFSKGGFVSVPVVMAAKAHRVPIVIHESDMTPGLATKLCLPHAKKACTSFNKTSEQLGKKGICTGTPLRDSLFNGNGEICRKKLQLDEKPVILVMGGSLGAKAVNDNIRLVLNRLLPVFNVVHICGKGKTDELVNEKGYVQLEYVTDDLPDIMALADIVVTRGGSNSINEFLALHKPMIIIPLPAVHSRGDQLVNAEEFERLGYAVDLREEDITEDKLVNAIRNLYDKRFDYVRNMEKSGAHLGRDKVIEVIFSTLKG
jgi:UDP-N-acetylglucosamine--N-acetylmuramyl-(pentapeptide) pyrophosphoryl-undecaprenol N-acetylglucosamine transferase